MLERIERSNAFLVPLDEHREWYRYHHLFAELLRHELQHRDPGLVAALHCRAARWLMDAGLVSPAVVHLVAAGDIDEVADVVVSHWLGFFNAGERGTVGKWLAAIPDERLRGDGRLCLARGWFATTIGRPEEVWPWLEHAERAPAHSPAHDRPVWLEATVLRAATGALTGDLGQTRRCAEQITPLDGSSIWHSLAANLLGASARWRGDDAAAVELFKQAASLGRRDFPVVTVFASGQLASIAANRAIGARAGRTSRTRSR
jgi:LuxR family maltose regulon positive regulatory protein